MTPESIGFLEKHHAWSASPGGGVLHLPSRDAQALLLLDAELRKERIYADGRDS